MVCFANRTREKEKLVDHWLRLLSFIDQGQYVSAKHPDVARQSCRTGMWAILPPKVFLILT